jgi:hypothetical protein
MPGERDMHDLIFAYLAVWAAILGRLAYDELYFGRRRGRRKSQPHNV